MLQAASALGGERAGHILPEILRPRNWDQVSREERRKVRLSFTFFNGSMQRLALLV